MFVLTGRSGDAESQAREQSLATLVPFVLQLEGAGWEWVVDAFEDGDYLRPLDDAEQAELDGLLSAARPPETREVETHTSECASIYSDRPCDCGAPTVRVPRR